MKIEEYTKSLQKPLLQRTLTLLLKGKKVLLGYKKKGFGKNKYLGIGGKKEENETIKEAATREIQEEIGVVLIRFTQVATFNFFFPHVEDESWNQQVHVFIAKKWKGKPMESDEIRPRWFNSDQLPINDMWDDDRYWLPLILQGETLDGDFLFDATLKVMAHKMKQSIY